MIKMTTFRGAFLSYWEFDSINHPQNIIWLPQKALDEHKGE